MLEQPDAVNAALIDLIAAAAAADNVAPPKAKPARRAKQQVAS
jgi:hypothetical protein